MNSSRCPASIASRIRPKQEPKPLELCDFRRSDADLSVG